MKRRIKPMRDEGDTTPQTAAAEICRRVDPLIELAHKNGLGFLAYLLSMAAEEGRRIASNMSRQEAKG